MCVAAFPGIMPTECLVDLDQRPGSATRRTEVLGPCLERSKGCAESQGSTVALLVTWSFEATRVTASGTKIADDGGRTGAETRDIDRP